jgi:hypothetical protein
MDEQDRPRSGGRLARHPVALSARFDAERRQIVIQLSGGVELAFDPSRAEGLEHASDSELSSIQISPSGQGLHWPKLDADLFLPALLEGKLGSPRWLEARNA